MAHISAFSWFCYSYDGTFPDNISIQKTTETILGIPVSISATTKVCILYTLHHTFLYYTWNRTFNVAVLMYLMGTRIYMLIEIFHQTSVCSLSLFNTPIQHFYYGHLAGIIKKTVQLWKRQNVGT